MEDIEYYDIPVYNFPYDVEEDDEETIQDNSELRVCADFDLATRRRTLIVAHAGPDALRHRWIRGRS